MFIRYRKTAFLVGYKVGSIVRYYSSPSTQRAAFPSSSSTTANTFPHIAAKTTTKTDKCSEMIKTLLISDNSLLSSSTSMEFGKLFENAFLICAKEKNVRLSTALMEKLLSAPSLIEPLHLTLYFKSIAACYSEYEGRPRQVNDKWKDVAIDEVLFCGFEYLEREMAGLCPSFSFEPQVHLLVVEKLLKAGYTKEAGEHLIRFARKFDTENDVFYGLYSKFLTATTNYNRLDELLLVLKERNLLSRPIIFGSLLEAYSTSGSFDRIRKLLKYFKPPNDTDSDGIHAMGKGLCAVAELASRPHSVNLSLAIQVSDIFSGLKIDDETLFIRMNSHLQRAYIESAGFHIQDAIYNVEELSNDDKATIKHELLGFSSEISRITRLLISKDLHNVDLYRNILRFQTYISYLNQETPDFDRYLDSLIQQEIYPDTSFFNELFFAYSSLPLPSDEMEDVEAFREAYQFKVSKCMSSLSRMLELKVTPDSNTLANMWRCIDPQTQIYPLETPDFKILISQIYYPAFKRINSLQIPETHFSFSQKMGGTIRMGNSERYLTKMDACLKIKRYLLSTSVFNVYLKYVSTREEEAAKGIHLIRSIEVDSPEILKMLNKESVSLIFKCCSLIGNRTEAVRLYTLLRDNECLSGHDKKELLEDLIEIFGTDDEVHDKLYEKQDKLDNEGDNTEPYERIHLNYQMEKEKEKDLEITSESVKLWSKSYEDFQSFLDMESIKILEEYQETRERIEKQQEDEDQAE